jgi:hypothetical protein
MSCFGEQVKIAFLVPLSSFIIMLWLVVGLPAETRQIKQERKRAAAEAREWAEARRLSHKYPNNSEVWGDRLVAAGEVLEAKKRARIKAEDDAWEALTK